MKRSCGCVSLDAWSTLHLCKRAKQPRLWVLQRPEFFVNALCSQHISSKWHEHTRPYVTQPCIRAPAAAQPVPKPPHPAQLVPAFHSSWDYSQQIPCEAEL